QGIPGRRRARRCRLAREPGGQPLRLPLLPDALPLRRHRPARVGRVRACRPGGADAAFLGNPGGFVAQFAAQDLADVGLGQFGAKLDVLRPFVAGELVAQEVEQLALGQRVVLLDHEQLDHLARLLVGYADGGGLEHAGMRARDFLDLVRIHVEARDQDHVLLAVDDLGIAALVHDADVAALEEVVGRHDIGCFVGALPVPRHDLWAADRDLAGLASGYRIAVVIEDHDLGRGQRNPDGAAELGDAGRIARHAGRGLGQAVALDDGTAGLREPGLGDRALY